MVLHRPLLPSTAKLELSTSVGHQSLGGKKDSCYSDVAQLSQAYLDGSGLPTSVQAWNFLPLWMKGKTHFEGKTSPESVRHWSSTAEQFRVFFKTPSSKALSTRAAEAVHSMLISFEDAMVNWCRPANWRVPCDEAPPKEQALQNIEHRNNYLSPLRPFSFISFKTTPWSNA